MAIKNASDLLVYAKTANPAKQVTRIYVKEVDPLELPDGSTTGTIKINNITNNNGVVSDDEETNATANDGASVLAAISTILVTNNSYNQSAASVVSGDYRYREYTNGANGIVPTLEIVSGTATLNEDAIIVEIITPGSLAIFDPVAFSTSASFSTNVDLRDVTNKDSGGWSESLGGLKSFEVSTDLLQSINPDVPLDGTDFFDKLKERSLVDLSFSDRIRNIIRTNLTQSGVDGFLLGTGLIQQTNLQDDPFGGSTASKLAMTGSATYKRLQYNVDSSRIEGKYVTWTFYVKGDPASPNNAEATFFVNNGSDVTPHSFEILSGDGTIATLTTAAVKKITGLNTGANNVPANWTRVRVTYKFEGGAASATTLFAISPGLGNAQVADDIIYVSSWQIELSPSATDYQDPTDITHWQGNALVSSLSFDAGVEDNLTCSATFTGTGNVYPNGLGPELIGDTAFDLANDGSNPSSAYWSVGGNTVVENGYAKIIAPSGNNDNSFLTKSGILTAGDFYLLTYTIPSASPGTGSIVLEDAATVNIHLNKTTGTYKVQFKAGDGNITIKRGGNPCNIWLSSISLKKVL